MADKPFLICFNYLYLENAPQYGLILCIFIPHAKSCLPITLKTAVT